MKIAHFADIHISDARIKEFESLLQQLANSIIKREADIAVFAGDMFIHRDKLSPKQVELARTFFKEYLKDIPVVVITGNHDVSLSENKIDSLSAIFTQDKELQVKTQIGDHIDFLDTRFHLFPYPTKKEMIRLGISELSDLYQNFRGKFKLEEGKRNVLVYHGTLEGFNISDSYKGSEGAIGIGKDLIIPATFFNKFDAVMAGHLHRYQAEKKAAYCGCPFPLTFADSDPTGWLLWDDEDGELNPSFIELKQHFPYITVDAGNLSTYRAGATEEAVRRLKNEDDYADCRVRIKYTINEAQSGEVDHAELSCLFNGTKDIKLVPEYTADKKIAEATVSFEDFQQHNIFDLITKYIDSNHYHSQVKEIADKVEERIQKKLSPDDERGINFRPQKLWVRNFKCFGEEVPEIDFEEFESVVGIFGPNKTGKTSLIEALVWGFFGTTLRNKDVKSIIRIGREEAEVKVWFSSYGSNYLIHRKRGTHGGALSFHKQEEDRYIDISGATAIVTQKNIEKIIGTPEIFMSTVFSSQNDIDRLIKKKPSERKQIVLDCLQVDVLERRQREAADLRRTAKDRLQQEKGKLDAYTSRLTTLIANSPDEIIEEFKESIKKEEINKEHHLARLNTLAGKVSLYIELDGQNIEINNELTDTRRKLADLNETITKKKREKEKLEGYIADKSIIDNGLDRLRHCDEQIQRYTEEQTRNQERKNSAKQYENDIEQTNTLYNEQIALLSNSRELIINQIKNVKSLNCPKPDCPLDKEKSNQKIELRQKLDEVEEQIQIRTGEREIEVNQIKTKILELREAVKNSFYDGTEHMGAVQAKKAEDQHKWPELKYKLASGEDLVNTAIELITAYEEQRMELVKKREHLAAKRTDIAKQIADIDKYKHEAEKVKIDLNTCDERIKKCEDFLYQAKRDKKEISSLQNTIEDQHILIKKIETYLVHVGKYQDIVGKTGVIFSLVDKALPIIEKFAQNLLSETTNGSISIILDSYRLLSSGDKTDQIMIYISDAKGKRDVSEASGAETVLVSLALRAAMAHLLSLRMGSKVELFVIDEGMGALDDENKVVAKSMFTTLSKIFNRIMFITHVDELRDVAQSIVNLETDGVESKLTIDKRQKI